ncbi:MAG: OadG family protein [Oscillospiraceae bacterium]|jgi:Na+-transporting methylmalonyl-CoA/oxaloacetate decarboxylase gamma subunit|nr:OadG family protein [Oscillospiraceae bacterium]
MLFLTAIEEISIPNALLLSLIGFSVVFIALISIIAVIKVIATLSQSKNAAVPAPAVSAPKSPVPAAAAAGKVPAAGSQGEIDLYTVDDQTAAMLMAIVADDLKVPLNTLRFTSIREAS